MADDAALIQAAVEGVSAQPPDRTNEHALHDHTLPAIVRGFLAINFGSATETMAIREAGFMPRLYGAYQGRRVRVVMVSRMGDVGISFEDKEHGYAERVSIYDLTDFSDEMHPGAPAERKGSFRLHAIVDAKGFWSDVRHRMGTVFQAYPSDVPVLHTESAKAHRLIYELDPHGLQGLRVIPLILHRGKE